MGLLTSQGYAQKTLKCYNQIMKSIKTNIWKIYVLYGIRGALIHIPILVIFLQDNGLSLQQVFILQATWSVIQIILEVPSGYVSDKWGRKPTIIVGTLCKVLGIFAYCLGTNFLDFAVAVTMLAIGSSFFSGTMEALTYDTLLELDETDKYRKVSGTQYFYQFGSEALGGLLGGVLAVSSLRTPFWATFIFFSIAPLIACTLREPKRYKLQEKRHLRAMYDICVNTIVRSAPLRSVILLHSVIITIAFTLYWFTQPYQVMVGLPLAMFGVMHTLIVGVHALSSKWAHTLERWVDDRMLLTGIAVTIVLCFFAIASISTLWGLAFFVVARAAWGLLNPVTSETINRMTTSEIRATVLSLRSLFFRILFTLIAPFVGYAADVFSLKQAILLTGAIGGVSIVILLVMMQSVWKRIPR